jgi:hypothetical protein
MHHRRAPDDGQLAHARKHPVSRPKNRQERSMTRRVPFRQIDVTRAIRAAKASGVEISKVEIHPDGRIEISNAVGYMPTTVNTAAPEPSALERWKAKQDAKRIKAEQRH